MTNICAVILAAGLSRRLGFNKLLVKIDKRYVIQRTIEPFLNSEIDTIFVVVGFDKQRVVNALKKCNVVFIDNPFHQKGMSTSIKAALPYINGYKGVFFQLGDRPFVKKDLILRMIDTFYREPKDIFVPVYEGKKGHPVLIKPFNYLDEISSIKGDVGLREIIDKHVENVVFIESHKGVLEGVDTLDDIKKLKERGYEIEKD